jgi:predicted regulator of Ras-like GTPase activity (Roadblock/LC7/MglB family)
LAGFLRELLGRIGNRALALSGAPAKPAAALVPSSPPSAGPTSARSTEPCAANANEIELPLASVLASLPLELKAKLVAAPPASGTILLQAEMVISQLAFGAVKISFGELRHLAPGIFVNSAGELDNKLINLPLQEILPRLNPALLARRVTRKVEVIDAIVGPFAERGRGFTFTTQPLKSASAASPPRAPEPTPEPSAASVPPLAVRSVSPPPSAPLMPPRSTASATPTNSTNGMGHSHPLAMPPPVPPRSVTPPPTSGLGGNGQLRGNVQSQVPVQGLPPGLRLGSLNGHGQAGMPAPAKMQATPFPALGQKPLPATPPPVSTQPAIFALLGDLCQNWPEDLKSEILQTPLAQIKVPLDAASLLPGLKRGRVVMVWKQIRLLAQPNSPPSPNDALELELPLKVIAPLFLDGQKNSARSQPKAAVSADIPDLFFGFPQPTPTVAPVAPVVPPLPKPVEPTPQDTNFCAPGDRSELLHRDEPGRHRSEATPTDFLSRVAHPKDVVARAVALPGVAGSLVTLQDGLRVASQVPAEFNADTLAAFLPQIAERVNQCTRELRMGALNNLSFTVGNVPWKIFRVNAVYFAAFGRAGEPLPSAQLAQLAAALDRKT